MHHLFRRPTWLFWSCLPDKGLPRGVVGWVLLLCCVVTRQRVRSPGTTRGGAIHRTCSRQTTLFCRLGSFNSFMFSVVFQTPFNSSFGCRFLYGFVRSFFGLQVGVGVLPGDVCGVVQVCFLGGVVGLFETFGSSGHARSFFVTS